MPMKIADYHPDWRNVARQIREQARDRCEFCGVPNGEHVVRSRTNPDELWWVARGMELEHAILDGEWVTKIVLTTAHLCDDKKCIDPTHLRALCQRCHLNLDRPHHLEIQRQNRIARKLAEPLPLFGGTAS